MVSVAHKYSATEVLATFILVSDGEGNDSFGDELSLKSLDRHDSKKSHDFMAQKSRK